ncbi:hypothetical protein BJ322DRAFT_1162006 [Thelephora terrestris]|uniref:F-box domain-containing protein n=1 Tax=Thelephora terrestris TaxID=56493 RepID=A0A9P6L4J6_9AGAM|nr:hypothetical protein BJ322DRAFT_1162006 [Thelephora terrestris]
MGAATSKSRHSKTESSNDVANTPGLPQELLDEIIDHLADDPTSLRRCSIAASNFLPTCRRHLFKRIVFRPHNLPAWKVTFPNPSTCPAAYTHEMRIHLAPSAPIQLAEYMPYFSNVRDLTLIGGRCEVRDWIPSLGRLPTSIRSLTMKFASITNAQVLEIMEQLPNLDDISLSAFREAGLTAEAGEILRGRYSGKLDLLLMEDFHAGIVRSLLKAPEGLGFRSIKALCNTEDDFPVYVDLVASCQDTLVDLDISVSADAIVIPNKITPTFNFLHHKSLEHLSFSLLSNFASCRWLSTALSTIDPTNSPRLRAVTIYLHRHVPPARIVSETALSESVMKDLRDVGSEIKRIRAASGGSVKFEIAVPLPWVMKPLQTAWTDVLNECSFSVEY